MENLNKRSIIDMARGAIKERADYEMTRVVADEESIVEMVPQIPGQLAVDAGEQEAPPMLKLIHTA